MKRMSGLALLLMVMVSPLAIGQTELTATMIEIREFPDYVPKPIKIVGLKYRGGEVKYVEEAINFPRDSNDNPILAQIPLSKGINYMLSTEQPASDDVSIPPNKEVDLAISEEDDKNFEIDIKGVNSLISILHSVKIKAEASALSPNHLWFRGAYNDRDPQDPKRWVVNKARKLRQISQMKRAAVKKMGFQPFHAQTGCYQWVDSMLLTCNCTGCFASQDQISLAPFREIGWRPQYLNILQRC